MRFVPETDKMYVIGFNATEDITADSDVFIDSDRNVRAWRKGDFHSAVASGDIKAGDEILYIRYRTPIVTVLKESKYHIGIMEVTLEDGTFEDLNESKRTNRETI